MKFKIIILLLLVYIFSFARAEVVDRIIATVNGDILTLSDIAKFKVKLKKSGLLDEALLTLYNRSALLNNDKTLINYMIDELILDSEIKRLGLIAPIEQVEGEITNITKQRNMDREQLKSALASEGVLFSDYQNFIKTSIQRQMLIQREVSSKIKISDEEVDAYYAQKFSNTKSVVYEYSLAHILFLESNGGAKEALSRAEAVRKKLLDKIPFDTLASQYSEDPQFVQGGVFGTFQISDLNKSIQDVIAKLEVSDISPVVKMKDGFHIFKALKKNLVPSADLEHKREEIRRSLMNQNFQHQFKQWIEKKRTEVYLRLNE
jgi:peptidyl-prolyl cis-trans isomerase SurA